MDPSPIRILIVDDHEIVREGLQALLAEEPDLQVSGLAADGPQAIALAAALRPDVILMDLLMSGMSGIEAMQRIRARDPQARVLVLTTYADDRHVREAIQAGAIGYLLKDVLKPELVQAIHAAVAGKPTLHPEAQKRLMQQVASSAEPSPLDGLTERERAVLALIARGRSNKEISAALHLTEGTVKGYVSVIFSKLGVADRTQAALLAVKFGLGDQAGV
jgi:DNA-binding NarL/FixJ family response regulator